MRKLTSAILACTMLVSSVANAQNIPRAPDPWPGEPDVGAAMSPVHKGDPAIFTGVLLSPKAIAIVVAELNSAPERTAIEVSKARAEEQAKCDYSVNKVLIQAEADKSIMQAKLDYSNKEINVLNDRLSKVESSQPNLLLWVGGGFAAGVITSVATTFLITKATH